MIKIGIIGYGYWGPNLVRNFILNENCTVKSVADKSVERLNVLKKSYPNVEILKGLSEEVLPSLLPRLSGDINFWLDGHYSGGITGCGTNEFPIMEELESILQWNVKKEVIYIDDLRLLRSFSDEINLDKIKNMCLSYKPECKISFESSDYDLEDILIIEY